jgi:hypothetical protein
MAESNTTLFAWESWVIGHGFAKAATLAAAS